jgi:myosin heavy subunit
MNDCIELSYQQLCVRNAPAQAVVISGESGAGKLSASRYTSV